MLDVYEIEKLQAAKNFARSPNTSLGAYPLALITSDGGVLCSCCTHREFELIARETFDDSNCGFRVAAVVVNWEDEDLTCDHCNERISSAYGEDE